MSALRRRMSSKASLASLSTTSVSTRCSSREQGAISKKSQQPQRLLSSDGTCRASKSRASKSRARHEDNSSSGSNSGETNADSWITRTINHFFGLLFQMIYPELFTMVELLRTMVINYRDHYILQHFHTVHSKSGTSFSSIGERMVRRLETTQPASSLSQEKHTTDSCHADFLPRVRLIECEHDCHEHWGHFADFECVEDDDATFLAFRTSPGS